MPTYRQLGANVAARARRLVLVLGSMVADDELGPSDRRSVPRHPITLKVDYKRVNTFFADYAKNISKGGTFIATERPLDIGTEFVFLLTIPTQSAPIELHGMVVWTVAPEAATPEQPAGMGIQFRFDRDQERRSLHGLVEKLMSDKLGAHVAEKLLGKV